MTKQKDKAKTVALEELQSKPGQELDEVSELALTLSKQHFEDIGRESNTVEPSSNKVLDTSTPNIILLTQYFQTWTLETIDPLLLS